MINAYILLEMQPGDSEEPTKEMKKIQDVVKVSIVAGKFDVVVRVQVKHLEDLHNVTHKIQMVSGVKKTNTLIIEKEIVL